LLIIIFSCSPKDGFTFLFYKEYVPLVFDEKNGIIESKKILTAKHQENVIHVLEHYNEKWKIKDGKLFVSRKITTELLMNYTTKANDSIWLVQNKLIK
jgi:hypothetical protein